MVKARGQRLGSPNLAATLARAFAPTSSSLFRLRRLRAEAEGMVSAGNEGTARDARLGVAFANLGTSYLADSFTGESPPTSRNFMLDRRGRT
jgi:hypothetical protein